MARYNTIFANLMMIMTMMMIIIKCLDCTHVWTVLIFRLCYMQEVLATTDEHRDLHKVMVITITQT